MDKRRLQLGSQVFDYTDESKDVKAKAERLTALQELQDFIADPKNVSQYCIPHLDLVMEMIEKNIFRPLPLNKKSSEKIGASETGVEEEEMIMDPAWPHL